MSCYMREPSKFPSLDSCQKMFLWANKEVNIAPHSVIGLVGDTDKFAHAHGFESLDFLLLFKVSRHCPCFTAIKEAGVTRDLYSLNLLTKLLMLHRRTLLF